MADKRLKELKEAINRFKLIIEHAKKAKKHTGTETGSSGTSKKSK